MSEWIQQVISQDWFWFTVVPIVSVILAMLFNSLSRLGSDPLARTVDISAGIDLCIEAWGVNLGVIINYMSGPDIPVDIVEVFLAVTLAQVILLAFNALFLSINNWREPWKTLASNGIGVSALILSLFAWKA